MNRARVVALLRELADEIEREDDAEARPKVVKATRPVRKPTELEIAAARRSLRRLSLKP